MPSPTAPATVRDSDAAELMRRVDAIRAFNRYYGQRIGVLDATYMDSPFSLAEARVLYELSSRAAPTASEIARDLTLDPGYLSRILHGFMRAGLVTRDRSMSDARQWLLSLTPRGKDAFAPIEAAARQAITAMVSGLTPGQQQRVVDDLHEVMGLLTEASPEAVPDRLRPHGPGDLGWIVQRHGALYAEEYGWDATFEALVAEIAARFLRTQDPARERCWIAERHGVRAGSVLLVRDTERQDVAQLRLLLVEPMARGHGLGRRLVDACTEFAREAGYHTISLWTTNVLLPARGLYEAAGYHLMHQEPMHAFGHDLVSQTWELPLGDG